MLENLKELLGIDGNDLDTKLNQIISHAKARLRNKIGGIDPPEELEYIIVEVSVKRFNKIGSEGLSSHTVDGESLTFSDDDFTEFESDIQTWLSAQKSATKGRVRFL